MYASADSRLKENPTFIEFVISCARNTEYFNHMEGMDPKAKLIKREYETLYRGELEKGKKTLKEFTKLMPEEYQRRVLVSRKEGIAQLEQDKIEKGKLRSEYTKMLMEIKAWKPPTDEHIEIKRLMLQEIESGIAFECDVTYEDEKIAELSGKVNLNELFNEQVNKLEEDIEICKQKVAEDKAIVDEVNKYIDDFVTSLRLTPEQREKYLDF